VARYAKSLRAQLIGQLFGLPLAIICAAFGCITTSAIANLWGEAYWNPYALLNGILDHTYSSKSRAGCFFVALSFTFATLGTSIACNIVPFAADVTCLVPKYINIIRGQFLCLLLGFAITPWHILTSAPTFLNFLGGYSIFQGSVVSIMLVDYFFVRRGNLDVAAMYSTSSRSKYFFFKGINLRAMAAFIVGFAVPLPGFIGSFGTTKVSVAATRLFNLGWALSFVLGGLSYWILCKICPVPGQEDCTRPYEDMVDEVYALPGVEDQGEAPMDEEEKKDATVQVVHQLV
jgi:NCS1 family nucleobase:cation symporter-1